MTKGLLKQSERVYGYLLKLYPKSYRKAFGEEMKFVFLESLKDEYKARGLDGILAVWTRTFFDTGKSLIRQHYENSKGGDTMKKKNNDLLMQNKIFAWLAVGTGAILSIPYLAMTFNLVKLDPSNPLDQGVNWTFFDFVVMGILIFGAGTVFIAIARSVPRKYRLLVGLGVLAVFLITWAHLAVGLVDSWPLAGS